MPNNNDTAPHKIRHGLPWLIPVLVAMATALAAAAAGTATAGSVDHAALKKANKVVISTRRVPGLGTVLVDSRGLTLYMFVPDKRRRVTCVGTCAALWPPVFLPKGAKTAGVKGVKQKLLGSDRDPAGGRVVTYHGWPLYTYVADRKPGMATGQALNLNGGLWYVLAPSGAVIHKKAT